MAPLLWLTLSACHGPTATPSSSDEPLSIAPPSYIVLAQCALTAQADGDTIALRQLLAPAIRYTPPDGPDWCGPVAVWQGWRGWQQQQGIAAMHLRGLTHLPIRADQPLPLTGRAGVYVVSYGTALLHHTNGHQSHCLLHVCYHFDSRQRIDYAWLSTHPIPNPASVTITQ